MRLISLELHNFRQHVDSRVEFTSGVTGILGPNGAGKSTILEAIAWVLYGEARGKNETIRSHCADGGSEVRVVLAFELRGSVYRVSRSLQSTGRGAKLHYVGRALLEVDGTAISAGTSEISARVERILGMDRQAFFTSFFTAQKELEFMASLDGRARAAAIGRMLGYDRLTKARDQANSDRLGLAREIEGLEKGLADPEELKQRKNDAQGALAQAKKVLDKARSAWKKGQEAVDRLGPLKEAADQKAKHCDRITREIELARAEIEPLERRAVELSEELSAMKRGWSELEELAPRLRAFEEAAEEYRGLAELQRYDRERQGIAKEIELLDKDVANLADKAGRLQVRVDRRGQTLSQLVQTETDVQNGEARLRALREQRVAWKHSTSTRIVQLTAHLERVRSKRGQIVDAGAEGACPTCERPLGDELGRVLVSFDAQIDEVTQEIDSLRSAKPFDDSQIADAEAECVSLADQLNKLRADKLGADRDAVDLDNVVVDREQRAQRIDSLRVRLSEIPTGFDQQRYDELRRIGEELKPIKERATELEVVLKRESKVREDASATQLKLESERWRLAEAEDALSELGFSTQEHEKITDEFVTANEALTAIFLDIERRRGEVNTASAILANNEREEKAYKAKVVELTAKRSERLHLDTLAKAFDALRTELNDRIRPELESIASELLSEMTDGRYNTLKIDDGYKAVIIDDGEEKPVISGGEDDIVNLALRLAVSQMIADRAGQSFSLLVLDEVFGSLDDVRRDNVVALLQNLKNRFEQIIVITHVESIHDAVDNCLWVAFDEKTKTSRLIDRSIEIEPTPAVVLA